MTLAPCANQACRKPVALDLPGLPAGILCVDHVAPIVGDLSAVDRITRCQHAAATCPNKVTVATIIGGYCGPHAPMHLRLTPHNRKSDIGKEKMFAARKREEKRGGLAALDWEVSE